MKVRLPAIMLNYDFYSKPRTRLWIQKHGSDAVVILQTIWIASSQEKGCKIRKTDVGGVVFPILVTLEQVQEVLRSAVEVGLLEEDAEHYYNSQILNDYKAFETKRKHYSEARRKREFSEDSRRTLKETTQNPIECVYEPETENEPVPELETEEVTVPDSYPPEVSEAVTRWRTYQRTKFRKDFGQLEADALVMRYAGRIADLIRDITGSISNQWRIVCDCTPKAASPPKFIDFDEERRRKNAEARAKFLAGDDDDKARTSKIT